MSDAKRALLELARRAEAAKAAGGVVAGIRAELFKQQLDFIDDGSRAKAALCTRRAGKTAMWARYCTIVALQSAGSLIRVWGSSRLRTKQLLWQEFLDVCARHKISVKAHETELTIRFDNGSEIRLVGADKAKEAEKKRGDKTKLEVILEAQLFGPFLRSLVDDVITPCLFDLEGTICMEGTPGPLPNGFWFAVSGSNDVDPRWKSKGIVADGELVGGGWSCHRWSLLDNPMMPRWRGRANWKDLAKIAVREERESKGWTEEDPTYVREYLGKWVRDDSALYYAVNPAINSFSLEDVQPWGPGWSHVLGLDVGWTNATAITVWGWHENDSHLYEAACWSESGVLAPKVAEMIQEYQQRFNIIKMVGDFGGGGRLYLEDMRSRFHLQIDDAQKSGTKWSHTMVMNDSLRSGIIKMQEGGALLQQMSVLARDPDWSVLDGKPPKEHPGQDNDKCDSAAYSFRECLQMFIQPAVKKHRPGSKEYFDEKEERYVESLVRNSERSKDPLDEPIYEEDW